VWKKKQGEEGTTEKKKSRKNESVLVKISDMRGRGGAAKKRGNKARIADAVK